MTQQPQETNPLIQEALSAFRDADFKTAERLFRRQVIKTEMRFGSNHPLVAEALIDLIPTLEAEGKHTAVAAARKRIAAILAHSGELQELPELRGS